MPNRGRPQRDELRLGEEMLPPRPEEDAATKLLVDGTIGLMNSSSSSSSSDGRSSVISTRSITAACARRFIVSDGLPSDRRVGVFARPQSYDAVIRFSMGAAEETDSSVTPTAWQSSSSVSKDRAFSPIKTTPARKTSSSSITPSSSRKTPCACSSSAVREPRSRKPKPQATPPRSTQSRGSSRRSSESLTRCAPSVCPARLEMTYFSMVPSRLGNHGDQVLAVPAPGESIRPSQAHRSVTKRRPPSGDDRLPLNAGKVCPVRIPGPAPERPDSHTSRRRDGPLDLGAQDRSNHHHRSAANSRSLEQLRFCEDLSYTPWHSLEAHRPIGGINRARRPVYEATSKFRHEQNQCGGKSRRSATLTGSSTLFYLRSLARVRDPVYPQSARIWGDSSARPCRQSSGHGRPVRHAMSSRIHPASVSAVWTETCR